MKDSEWLRLSALAEQLWKDEFDDGRMAAYWEVLEPFDARDVRAGMIAIARDGEASPWMPSAQELAAATRRQKYFASPQWAAMTICDAMREVTIYGSYLDEEAYKRTIADVKDAHPVYGPRAAAVLARLGHRGWSFGVTKHLVAKVDAVFHELPDVELPPAPGLKQLEPAR